MTETLKLALVIPLAAWAFGLTALDALAAEGDFRTEAGFVSHYNRKDLTCWSYRGVDGMVTEVFVGQPNASDKRYTAQPGVWIVNPSYTACIPCHRAGVGCLDGRGRLFL